MGAMLLDSDAVIRVGAVGLVSGDFWHPPNQTIYKAIAGLADAGTAVDYHTVGNALEQARHNGQNCLEFVGGWAGLTRLVTRTSSTVHVTDYARQLKALSFRRHLISLGGKLVGLGHNHEGTLEQLQGDAMRMVADGLELEDTESHLYGSDETLLDYLVTQQQREERLASDPAALVETPWPDLNRLISDTDAGIVHVVAARPGVGKTIYLEGIAEYNAQRGKRVAFYHLELSNQFMLDRRMARHSHIAYDELKRGYCGDEVQLATAEIAKWQRNVTYIHCPTWPVERIVADAQRLHTECKADVVLVDYLQRIPLPEVRNRSEWTMVGQVMARIKDGAERMGVPLFLACQLVRDMEKRGDNPVPRMSDLYGGAHIEMAANQIVILHNPQGLDDQGPAKLGPDDAETGLREAYVVKNTQGAMGKVTLVHFRREFQFGSLERGEAPRGGRPAPGEAGGLHWTEDE